MTHHKATPSPTLTAQRPSSNRIQIAGFSVAVLALIVFAFVCATQQYSRNPTNEILLITVLMIFPFFGGLYWLAKMLVPKVEFFENHLVTRSHWGSSRKRSCQEISKLEVKYGRLFITFKDSAQIELRRIEINFEALTRWLAEQGVIAARDFENARRLVEQGVIAARDLKRDPRMSAHSTTDFQEHMVAAVEKLASEIGIAIEHQLIRGEDESYYLLVLTRQKTRLDVYVYLDEAGFLEGEDWHMYERWDYDSPEQLQQSVLSDLKVRLS